MNKVCICGGGALGMAMAAVIACREDCKVALLTGHPDSWSGCIIAYFVHSRTTIEADIQVSNKAADLVPDSDIILLCVPGFLIEPILHKISPYLTEQAIGSVVSSTGFFQVAHRVLGEKAHLFGFRRVPYIARVGQYGKSVDILGSKNELHIATENLPATFCSLWAKWLNTQVVRLNNWLEAALSNSNPILHPSRLYGLWHDWNSNIVYPEQKYFYRDWDNLSSEIYISCDKELSCLCSKLGVTMPSVLEYYESTDAVSLTRKLQSIEAFRTIKAPMKAAENGWIPDFSHRYFQEDFPFGLQLIKDLSLENNIPTPTIDIVLEWGNKKISECGLNFQNI